VFRKLASWLRNSSHFHLKQEDIASLPQLVGLLDRFLDDELQFPLEWDDFISWGNKAPAIEAFRVRIAATEPLFFSEARDDRHRGVEIVVNERNQAAKLAGIPARELPAWAEEYAV
jgi:hypothetical protein